MFVSVLTIVTAVLASLAALSALIAVILWAFDYVVACFSPTHEKMWMSWWALALPSLISVGLLVLLLLPGLCWAGYGVYWVLNAQ